jgi:hypothetical protein
MGKVDAPFCKSSFAIAQVKMPKANKRFVVSKLSHAIELGAKFGSPTT